MSKELFEQASKNLYEKMITDGVTGIMQYKPFSDDYWNQNPRIVVCNYENIGYQDSVLNLLTYEHFETWLDVKKNKIKSKTVHYTAMFASALKSIIQDFGKNEIMTYNDLRNSYGKSKELYKSMENIMYMNLRPTSAKGNKQEIKETHKIIRYYKNEMKAYLESLNADIFILSSKNSVGLWNFIFDIKDNPLVFKKCKRMNKMMVFSMKHFGRPNYKYWHDKILEIASTWFHD